MTEPSQQADFDKALLLLPWYAKGKLSGDVTVWVSKQLGSSATLRKELSLIEKQIVKTEVYVDQIDIREFENNPKRLSKLILKISANTSAAKTTRTNEGSESATKAKPKKKTLIDKLLSLLPTTQAGWQTAGALALGIMILQGVVISQLYQDKTETEYTTLSESEDKLQESLDEAKPSFITRFHLNASVYDVDGLLIKYHLTITNGPDSAGIYQLSYNGEALTDEAIDEMITELEAMENIIRFIAREN